MTVMARNGHRIFFLHRNPQANKLNIPEMNKRHSAKQSYFTFFISLFITFQSRSLSPATLWIMKNAFACSGLTAARSEENQMCLPSQAPGPVQAII